MDKIDMCIWAVNVIESECENPTAETIQKLKDNFEVIFSDDAYFQKYRLDKDYFHPHHYSQKMIGWIQEGAFDEKKALTCMSQVGKWIRRDIINAAIEYFCNREDVEKVKEYISKLSETETEYQGYRMLLKVYARKGDLRSFQGILKDCKPKESPRSDIDECKMLLMEVYSLNNGLDKALELCLDKKWGVKYLFSAVSPIAKQLGYNKTKNLFSENEILNQAKLNLREKILVEAYAADQAAHEDEDAFKELYALVDNVDRTIKSGDFRLRDSLLFDLALCLQHDDEKKYAPYIAQCRKAIKNNFLKREI